MKQIKFHPDASSELESSFDWYFEREPKAALGFVAAVDNAVEKIAADPGRFPAIDDRNRVCNLTRYPFQVVFREKRNFVYIVAIAHAKRRPGYWAARE